MPDSKPRPKSNKADYRDRVCSRCIVGYPVVPANRRGTASNQEFRPQETTIHKDRETHKHTLPTGSYTALAFHGPCICNVLDCTQICGRLCVVTDVPGHKKEEKSAG